ncbi:MAG: helix-turn-helix domain-containing protein [Ruminococcaceae bacterium]|nr:helix-turn-helix domain-containing protein [Oscillospiraceae bacterium]
MILHQVSNSLGNYNYNAFVYRDTNWEAHFHGNFELIYVFEGTANITVNGISDTLQESELILLPPHTVHSLQVTSSKVWVGVFSEDFIDIYAKKYKYVRYSKFKCREDIEEILKKHLFFQGVPERFLHISCLYMVCNECIKNAVVYNQGQNHKFISEVVTYISKNLNYDITLKETAESLNYEYHYFSSLFHQYFCMNFKSFINLFRFEKACALLTDKENSVTYVAESCGFGSIRNFNRVFKKLSGYTPREYKDQHLDNKTA